MRVLLIFFTAALLSPAQSLFDLAPDAGDQESLPLRWTAGVDFGYDDSPGTPPSRNFFFGDSLSDSGNVALLLGGLGPGYPGNTFSNGPVWTEYFDPTAITSGQVLVSGGPLTQATNFSVGGATTASVLDLQIQGAGGNLLRNAIRPTDRAFLWAGGNDFIPLLSGDTAPTPEDFTNTVTQGVSNLTQSVALLDANGFRDITVFSLINVGLTPRADGFEAQGAQLAGLFNASLQNSLQNLPLSANLLWVDINTIFDDAIANPAAYGVKNTTGSVAPNASSGVPSNIPLEDQSDFLFYDDIHPTTGIHEQIALFVADHLTLGQDSESLNLVTDAALALDDQFGFENHDLANGKSNLNVATFYHENQSSSRRRNTTGVRADFDFALSDHLLVGGEFFYSEGDTSAADFESQGFGLDASYRDSLGKLDWEIGFGGGFIWGDLTRDYNTGTLSAESAHDAQVLTAHAALRNSNWTLGKFKAHWEIGLKQRFVRQIVARESGAASLSLTYSPESLHTTLANLEMGLELNPKLNLELSLNPVLFHHGGSIESRQATGLATFATSDQTGYDVHTARAALFFQLKENTTLSTTLTAGSDNTWATNLSLGLRF